MVAVAVRNVSKRWGETTAVEAVSFTAEAGQLVVLLGPSGCGKSTTLRLIAGLDVCTSGSIEIDGKDVTAAPPAGRGVSMVFQSYALFPHLSVAENIVFGLRVRKVPPAEREARLKRAADLLGLTGLLERKPSQLSGGQQQRVALGRAIVAETPVCLMDEPLSNLDAQLRAEMRREIRALQQRLGVTMLYVTHDQTEAMTMADQVILMRAGRIEQAGSPADLYERPASAFVARFMGTPPMNVLDIDAARRAGGEAMTDSAPSGAAQIGVRPEDLAPDPQGLHATVTTVEYLGADSLVHMDVAGQPALMRTAGGEAPRPGASVRVGWRPSAAHWFDAVGGRRID